jgi:hypothetical protein
VTLAIGDAWCRDKAEFQEKHSVLRSLFLGLESFWTYRSLDKSQSFRSGSKIRLIDCNENELKIVYGTKSQDRVSHPARFASVNHKLGTKFDMSKRKAATREPLQDQSVLSLLNKNFSIETSSDSQNPKKKAKVTEPKTSMDMSTRVTPAFLNDILLPFEVRNPLHWLLIPDR